MVLGPERAPFFGKYRIDKQALLNVFFGFLVFSVIWGWIWYGIRALLLRKFVGLNERTCQNQKPIVKKGQRVKKAQIIADGILASAMEIMDALSIQAAACTAPAITRSSRMGK